MNERIKNLIAKSGIYVDTSGRWISVKELDKLTSTIVRECATIARQGSLTNMNGNQIAYVVNEHFGLED